MNRSYWNVMPAAPPEHLAGTSGFSPLIAQLLYNRGLVALSQIELFLAGDSRLAGDPFLLPDMHQAVSRIYQALLSGEKVAVYGDFDVDGITATALLVKGLSALGGKAIPYIPHRSTEGHGLNIEALEGLYQQGVRLVVTVDCGVTDLPELERAREMGLDVVVTDHHTSSPSGIPPAVAVVDPKLPGSSYSAAELSGVGVAYKVFQALLRSMGKEERAEEFLDLVALGTVADMTPLRGENRYLVRRGLELLNAAPRLGVGELMARAGLTPGRIDAEDISWVLAPRLNAAGRMEHARDGYRLLMADTPEEAQELSGWLEKTNVERQRLTADVLAKARAQILAEGVLSILIAAGEDYVSGVAGLVAGRLAEEFYRPVVVIELGDAVSHGSCRSIAEFNIIAALNGCPELFVRFGGHAQAAGFVIPTGNLPRLREHLRRLADDKLSGVDLRPHIDVDAEVRLPALGGDTFPSIQRLAPFGSGNPLPTFLSRGVELVDCRPMGNSEEHLRLKLRQDRTVWDGVGFGLGDGQEMLSAYLDIVYNLEVDSWGGRERLRLNIRDFRPAGG